MISKQEIIDTALRKYSICKVRQKASLGEYIRESDPKVDEEIARLKENYNIEYGAGEIALNPKKGIAFRTKLINVDGKRVDFSYFSWPWFKEGKKEMKSSF